MTHRQAIRMRIEAYLEEKHWTKYRLARESAVPTSTLANLLSENGRSFTFQSFLDICRELNVEPSAFLDCELFRLDNLDD